jgi:hypothetical protein
MKRRSLLVSSLAALAPSVRGEDRWGESLGFPIGWGPEGGIQKWEGYTQYHVGNFSGGLETLFAHQVIRAGAQPYPLKENKRKLRAGLLMDASDYMVKFNRPGLLITRQNEIWHEEYRFGRDSSMRFFGWSMTKSIVGLLVGIAFDQGLLHSLDDRIDKYVEELREHEFADITLRNLLNMTSGINICEQSCSPNNGFERYGYSQIGYSPRRGKGTDQIGGILSFRWGRNEAQGEKFNYTDINPVLIAWVLESVFKMSLPAVAERYLWQPMGAAADATWLTDSKGFTFSGAGVSATLRDWALVGLLVANEGNFHGRQIVSKSWIDECSRHGPQDQAAKFNVARPGRGYRNFFWLHSADGARLRMAGAHSQNVLLDKKSKTVLVQAGVGPESGADEAMSALFNFACEA